jgi:hypothetical protein
MDSPGPGGKLQHPMTLKGSEYGLINYTDTKAFVGFFKKLQKNFRY